MTVFSINVIYGQYCPKWAVVVSYMTVVHVSFSKLMYNYFENALAYAVECTGILMN